MSDLSPLCAQKRTSADHSGFMVHALKHADGCCFYRFPQRLVQAVARHDVSLATEDAGSVLLDIHQFVNAELAFLIVEKEVCVGIGAASPRAVEPNM
jgi:hypothetical protein